MEKQQLLNTYVNNVDMDETVALIEQIIETGKKGYVVAVNVDVLVKIENDPYLKRIADEADLTLVDGKPLVWISKLYHRPVKAKISGSDLVPRLCNTASENGYSVFILGGKDGIAEKAKNNLLTKLPNINIVGTYSPPLGFEKNNDELEKINSLISNTKPNILIVCFGCPKQEK